MTHSILAELPALAPWHTAERAQALQARLNALTKPLGALGRLEALALRLGQILGTDAPQLRHPQVLVCAADHGVAAAGVSAYPSAVTAQMVLNFLAGGAAVSVLARQHALALNVVDCGVAHDFAPHAQLIVAKTTRGSANPLHDLALTAQQRDAALRAGQRIVQGLPGNAVLLGEMGIGNTSVAALLLARLGQLDIADCVGSGTGLDAAGVAHKTAVLGAVLQRHPAQAQATVAEQALAALSAFGGAEIATLAGAALQAASQRRVVVVDGFIASAAVLVAACLNPAVLQACVFAHQSAERGHALMLQAIERIGGDMPGVDTRPLLALDLRLGEGSGAALAWPLLQSACTLLAEMATFAGAGVSERLAS